MRTELCITLAHKNTKYRSAMNRIKESVIIALGVVVMGLCVKSGIDNYADKNRCVTVKGLSEREVEADKVIWP